MTSNRHNEFRQIHDESSSQHQASDNDYFFSYQSSLGIFWCSRKVIKEDLVYQPEVPPGIHLGAGNAKLTVTQSEQSSSSNDTTVASYLIVPEGQASKTETVLEKGRVISCGLFIEWANLQSLPSAMVTFIQKRVTDQGLFTTQQLPKSVLERLCAPITSDSHADVTYFIVESRVNELVASILSAFSSTKPAPRGSFKQVLQARDLIDDNLREPMTQKQLADKVGLNVRSLSSHFKEHIGMTINHYTAQTRMERGYQMLQQGVTVSQTAYLVGYSLPYFSEKFHKHFGLSPSQVTMPSAKDH